MQSSSTATKSSPPICPTNASASPVCLLTFLVITLAVNFNTSSPFKNPYISLYDLKLSKSKYNTEKVSFLNNLFFNSDCIFTFPWQSC